MHKHLNIIPAITRRHNKPAYVEFVFISGHSLRNIEEGASGLEDRPWESPVAGFGRVFFCIFSPGGHIVWPLSQHNFLMFLEHISIRSVLLDGYY